jgi:DNA-binding LytR/AlgR family response regulator
MTFKALAEHLPADRFMMVHKSYMVALGAVERLSGTDVIVAGRHIPVSRGSRERLKERLLGPSLIKRS